MADISVAGLLREASGRLAQINSPTPRIDAEWLLCSVLQRSSAWLRAWPEAQIEPGALDQFQCLLERRIAGEPVAYLLGECGFWHLTLKVTPDTLIPRPDTERLVELALARVDQPVAKVLDLGTGTGAIALALKAERPDWRITAVDQSVAALAVAKENSEQLSLPIQFCQSDWYAGLDDEGRFDLIVSNPPYIDPFDEHLNQGDLRFEPHSALVADQHGLADLGVIVAQAPVYLQPGGWLLVEHGFNQGAAVRELFVAAGFTEVATELDLAGHDRVTLGLWGGSAPEAGSAEIIEETH